MRCKRFLSRLRGNYSLSTVCDYRSKSISLLYWQSQLLELSGSIIIVGVKPFPSLLVLSHEESSEKGSVTYDLLACNNESVVDRPESSDSSRQPLTRLPFVIYQEPSPPERLCKSSIYRSDFVNYVNHLPMQRSSNGSDRCAERHFLACFWRLLEDNRYIGL